MAVRAGALEVALYPLAEVYAGAATFDAEHGPDVLRTFRDWARKSPREVSAGVRYLTLPYVPGVPERLRGRPMVGVTAAHSGPARKAEELLAPIRTAAPAVVDTFATIPAAARLAGSTATRSSPCRASWPAPWSRSSPTGQSGSASSAFDEGAFARLRRVKAQVDPGNLFRAGHQIYPG